MTTTKRLTALALAAVLAAPLAATAPAMAADPHGSTSTLPPRAPDPGPSVLPVLPETGPTIGAGRLLPPDMPGGGAEEEIDRMVQILLGADDLAYGHDVCYGMITCCNSAWVQGCNAGHFEDVCDFYGGVVQTQTFSDGSTHYECHYAD